MTIIIINTIKKIVNFNKLSFIYTNLKFGIKRIITLTNPNYNTLGKLVEKRS